MKFIHILLLQLYVNSAYCKFIEPMHYNKRNGISLSVNKTPSDTNYQYLKKVNNQIIFEKIYFLDSLKIEEVERNLISKISDIHSLQSFKKSDKIISFPLKNVQIDYNKYGLNKLTMNPILGFPLSCNISVIFKDEKCIITASDIIFKVVNYGEQRLTDHILNDKLLFDNNIIVTMLGKCVESFFSDEFNFDKYITSWN
jgi:hypothetical protein